MAGKKIHFPLDPRMTAGDLIDALAHAMHIGIMVGGERYEEQLLASITTDGTTSAHARQIIREMLRVGRTEEP